MEVNKLIGKCRSPSLTKIVFGATRTVAALDAAYGVALRGVQDVQLAELAGRPLPLSFHRKIVNRRAAASRKLRSCLE